MTRFRLFLSILFTAALAGAAPRIAPAQGTASPAQLGIATGKSKAAGPVRTIPPLSPVNDKPLEVGAPEQMDRADRAVAEAVGSDIDAQAAEQGYDLHSGAWSYREILCPVFPQHFFLRFELNQGANDRSLFTATVERAGGEVHVIPILRRGYSTYSGAPNSAVTVAVFNRVIDEEHSDPQRAWIALGMCYAALAGGNPNMTSGQQNRPGSPGTAPIIALDGDRAELRLLDGSGDAPAEWRLTFEKGQLVQATELRSSAYKVIELKPAQAGMPYKIKTIPPVETAIPPRNGKQ